jgi:hypothetical protein
MMDFMRRKTARVGIVGCASIGGADRPASAEARLSRDGEGAFFTIGEKRRTERYKTGEQHRRNRAIQALVPGPDRLHGEPVKDENAPRQWTEGRGRESVGVFSRNGANASHFDDAISSASLGEASAGAYSKLKRIVVLVLKRPPGGGGA